MRAFLPILLLSSCVYAGKLGGHKKVKGADDELHQELAGKIVDQLNGQSNDFFRWTLSSIDDVQQQMINGVKYTFHLTVAKSDCTKQATQLGRNDCKQGNKVKKCTATVIHRAWENFEEIEIVGCEEPFTRTRRHLKPHKRTSPFVMEEVGRTVKPKDYISWKRFTDFADRFEKRYESKRHVLHRFHVFKKNLRHIKKWQDEEQGTAVYGITQFADMTPNEWKKTYLPYVWEEPVYMNTVANLAQEGINLNDELPESFDWRDKGAVTGVKNQGNCGSCWAFSTTGNVEGQWYLSKGALVSLAEQQLVDCDSLDQGCNGGLPSNAYKEIIRMGGLEPEDQYPYDAKDETCHLTRKEIAVYINGSVELPHDEEAMKAWLVKKGPISIGINANPLQFYRHGISHPFKIFCEPYMLNHGVLIVGYGTEKKKPYWIIKNSWGEKWGEHGYYRLYRGKNVCGVQEMATSAVVN